MGGGTHGHCTRAPAPSDRGEGGEGVTDPGTPDAAGLAQGQKPGRAGGGDDGPALHTADPRPPRPWLGALCHPSRRPRGHAQPLRARVSRVTRGGELGPPDGAAETTSAKRVAHRSRGRALTGPGAAVVSTVGAAWAHRRAGSRAGCGDPRGPAAGHTWCSDRSKSKHRGSPAQSSPAAAGRGEALRVDMRASKHGEDTEPRCSHGTLGHFCVRE